MGGANVVFAQGKPTLRVSDQIPRTHFVYDSVKFWMVEAEMAAGLAVKFGDALAGTLTTAFLIRGIGFSLTDIGTIN